MPVHKQPYKISSTFFILTRVICRPLLSQTRDRKKPFLTGGVYPQPCKVKIEKINKSEFIFSVLAPSLLQPVSKNVFLLVQQPRCASLCVNVYICIYIRICMYYCTRVD